MQCQECKFENPEGTKFCGGCGGKLEIICPNCSNSNPTNFRFCGECGHNLTQPSEPSPRDLSFDEKIEKIQKYLPKGITEKILSQRDKIEGEKKQVTVMFCDLEGFTPLVEKLGPEEAYSIMDEVYEILIHKVQDYEGTVNEMTGDGIMALFGAPIALEDAPQRAIRSAYSIHREMTRFSGKIKQEKEGIPPLKMRIGIHTGPVVVGTLGNDLRVEFKAVGDTVNLASRMEDLAEPGATYVTEDTFILTEGLFRYESLGEKEVKGKEEPIRTYRVIGPSTRRTRFDVSAERGLTPFVGRDREIEILVDGFERVKQGRGQSFSIMAEAGVGKSRLTYEFRKAVANEDVTFLEGKCLSYSRGVPYHPIIDIYKSNFDIGEGDEDHQIMEKVERGFKQMGIDEASTLPYLLELLSVKDSGYDQLPLSPAGKKDRMIETMIRIPLKGSEIRPLIMVFEDLHWMDKSSEDALKYLLESISGARIFLIFTYRPEFVHTWGGKSYHNQLNLNRLSNRESLVMVNYLLGTEDIKSELEDLILEKTEGVPFFIEEFIKSLRDLNIIEKKDHRYHLAEDIQDLTIPSTIQDVIMARVDSLPEGAKEVLQIGSVIEREFSHELIERSMGLSERELLSHLSILKDVELLYERGIFPKSTYIFKHALTREVVYDSILTKRKKILHGEIGNRIEELYKDNLDEYYGVLAEHFINNENYDKGAEYSKLVERKAEKAASFIDAISYSEKRIACLEKLPVTDDVQKKIIDARVSLGLTMTQLGRFAKPKEVIDPIIEVALKIGYQRRLPQIYTLIGQYNIYIEEDFTKALHHLEEALRISEERNDMVSMFFARVWLSTVLNYNCEFERAISHIKTCIDINVAANNLWGVVTTKGILSYYYHFQGRVDLGYQTSHEALWIAEEISDIYSKSQAYMRHGVSCYYKGYFEEAVDYLLKGADFSERLDHIETIWAAQLYLASAYIGIEEYKKAKDHIDKAFFIEKRGESGPSRINLTKTSLARAKAMNNEKDINLESLYHYVDRNKIKNQDGWMQRYIGEILLNIGDQHISEAEDWINKAIEADKKNGMRWHLGRDYALYAELFRRKDDQSKAKENLNKAIDILKECGADGWIEKYEKDLTSLSS
jgi:class 3 adenylate cyclase/tetratricopeptide (TPR) repeat protein